MARRLLAAVLSATALASDSLDRRLSGMIPVHLDILIENLNYGRMSDADEQALGKGLAQTIASKLGARAEDVADLAEERGSAKILRGTALLDWLPASWPARANPSGETVLVACVVKLQKSTVFIAESAVNNQQFKEAIVESVGHALGPSSQAITGSMSVIADYIGPVNPEAAAKESFAGGGGGPTPRPPWDTSRSGGGFHVDWRVVWCVVAAVLLVLAILAVIGIMRSPRRRERSGGFLSMLGREPPRETWRDKFHDFMSPFWKKPAGGYGITGH